MNRKGNSNLGDEIKNIVQDALNNRNFNRLNRDIENVVKGALDEVGRSMGWKWPNNYNRNNQAGKSEYKYRHEKQAWDEQDFMQQEDTYNNMNYSNAYRQGYAHNNLTVPMGKMSGILFTVFGSIGSAVFGIALIVLTILGYSLGIESVLHTIALGLLPLFGLSVISCIGGGRIRKRLKRFNRYVAQLQSRNYCSIRDFSSATGLSDKATVKDLRKMIAIGMFPEGHIDDKKTCFMLDNESYDQYLKLQENMRMKDLEEQEKNAQKIYQNNKSDALDPEIKKAIDEGRQFVRKIKNTNVALEEEISNKINRLEEVTRKIYDYVEKHPEKFPQIKKFTEYFLPTTLKLVVAYRDFDYQPVQGENILNAKKEIEETMDTINLAFENLLDGLFEDAAMDISTDISVLETMFAQEGLTEENIKAKNKTMDGKQ